MAAADEKLPDAPYETVKDEPGGDGAEWSSGPSVAHRPDPASAALPRSMPALLWTLARSLLRVALQAYATASATSGTASSVVSRASASSVWDRCGAELAAQRAASLRRRKAPQSASGWQA
jgi:hypothetical protein